MLAEVRADDRRDAKLIRVGQDFSGAVGVLKRRDPIPAAFIKFIPAAASMISYQSLSQAAWLVLSVSAWASLLLPSL